MIKKENATIFQCEYCNKISYSAGGMRLHEICCKKNPINLGILGLVWELSSLDLPLQVS